jgi:dihydroorotate dehydrogenase
MEPTVRWNELVTELAAQTSNTQLAHRLGVTSKEIKRWKGDVKPQGRHAETLLKMCEHNGVNWRKFKGLTPVYDIRCRYDKNLADGPQGLPPATECWISPVEAADFFGNKLNSPLGVPASALTNNSQWIGPLLGHGFDIITYKTVRTESKPAHPSPNWVYVPELTKPVPVGSLPKSLLGLPDSLTEDISQVSMANSFGMPSLQPKDWQADVRTTLSLLKPGQVLIASVVGTADGPKDSLADNFVACARLAHEVKPHAIELNFSCPNVYGQEGSVYHNPQVAARICTAIAREIPEARILVKISFMTPKDLEDLFNAIYRHVAGFTAINTISAKIVSDGQVGEPVFSGPGRTSGGISGVAIREYAIDMVQRLRALAKAKNPELVIIGVGGVTSSDDVKRFQAAGANYVQICTAANLNPLIAQEIRKSLCSDTGSRTRHKIFNQFVRFSDERTYQAIQVTARVCSDMDVPFEMGYDVLSKKWLTGYLQLVRRAEQEHGSPLKTRRGEPPSAEEIELWLRERLEDGNAR